MKRSVFHYSFLLFFCFSLFGQAQEINFRQVSPPGGFALDGIHSILQDELGYMWMSSREGIIKCDSKNVHWIAIGAYDSVFCDDLYVNDIKLGKNGVVWIATSKGLVKYNDRNKTFNHIVYTYDNGVSSAPNILGLSKYDDSTLFIIDESYFGCLDLRTNVMSCIAMDTIISPTVIHKDKFNRIWFGTASGDVFRYYATKNEVRKIISNSSKVTTIYSDNDDIWIGTDGGGAKLYDMEGRFIKKFIFKGEMSNSDCGNVRVINKDTYGRTWFGTYEGLFMDDGKQLLQFFLDNYSGLPHNSIYEIFEDNEGGLWFGTWAGGVALVHHSDNNFKTYRHKAYTNSLSNNMVSSFCQISDHELLIGTEVGGLNVFNADTELFDKVSLSDELDIVNIKTLCKDANGGVWVGTFRDGLWYASTMGKPFVQFTKGPEDGAHISSSSIYSLYSTASGVWIGTFGNGLNYFDFSTKQIHFCMANKSDNPLFNHSTIRSLLMDSQCNLWIGTLHNGLFCLNQNHTETSDVALVKNVAACESRAIYCLWEHDNGDIWIGTKDKGLLIYHPEIDSIGNFDAGDKLKEKSIYGIIEDDNKHIWISSNKGLFQCNSRTFAMRQFLYSDGIQSDKFCLNALLKDHRGQLYFGGTNGFTKIHPDKVKVNINLPYTIINELIINNDRRIEPTYSDDLDIEQVTLLPNERALRINFSADNYLIPDKNRYKYRLINYYDEWITNENEGTVMFAHLDAGEYIFEVKACNNDGVWNEIPTQIKINVKEYWYLTNWALGIYFLLLLAVSYSVLRFYLESNTLRAEVLLEVNQRKNEERMHEMKLKFFTNVSHEFRTPLTLISWPLKKLLAADNITDEQREELEVVNRNSNRLLQLVKQIIDLRKLENGKSKLIVSSIDIISFIDEMQQAFKVESKMRHIEFTLESSFSELIIEADVDKLDTILYNLVSNAYKYAIDKGQIKITVNKTYQITNNTYTNKLSYGDVLDTDFVEIVIEDNGLGVDSDGFENIFDRFERGKKMSSNVNESVKGSGIGLSICKEFTLLHHGRITAQSTLGEGSRFTIVLPVKQNARQVMFESHATLDTLKKKDESIDYTPKKRVSNKGCQLLIVEDNSELRKFVSDFLSVHYQVMSATNGKEALMLLKDSDVDLILSDVMMPEMDGLEFCSIVKTQVETCHIPVILLTALSSSDSLMAGLDNGADAYLTKPLDQDVLLKQIDNLLAQRYRLRDKVMTQFMAQKPMEVSSLDNFFLNKVRAVVEQNICNDQFGMSLLAEELMISRSQLHRKIKSLSGMTTTEFVNLVRVKKAVELIKEKDYLFSEVAFKVGFSSQSYFTKCFKNVYNTTPKAYFVNLNKSSDSK